MRNILMLYSEVTANKALLFKNSQYKVFTEIVVSHCSVK